MPKKNILEELEEIQRETIKSEIKDMNEEQVLDFIINLINEKNKHYVPYPPYYPPHQITYGPIEQWCSTSMTADGFNLPIIKKRKKR